MLFSEFQDNSNPEFLDNSISQHGLHQNDKSLDLKSYKLQEERLKGKFKILLGALAELKLSPSLALAEL